MKKFGRKTAFLVLTFICGISSAFGLAACKSNSITEPVDFPTDNTTVRNDAPTDGSTPTDHTALENISYMASVLDSQSFYHAYATNSSRAAMGYEQITQTWKDYKNAELSGIGSGVMVCSDLSYSAFVKSATQSCFVGSDSAYMRTGSKPSKTSVATDIAWGTSQPEFYDRNSYLVKYGEFSTELSVYVITEDTLTSADPVVKNSDGTYSQKYYLNSDAAQWYQYGMKTRGSLKTYPVFDKIEITFTFDSNWQVLSSYAEETTQIAPGALGGISMTSTSQTTTVYDYSQGGFDNAHYSYFDGFFKNYVGKLDAGSSGNNSDVPELLDVLGGGFSKVVDAENGGQQFDLSLTIGDTNYAGKIYMHLADMSDILGSLDVRLQIGKENGSQDLYAEFANGTVNVYYSDGFAMTADIAEVAASVQKISGWINAIGKIGAADVAQALTSEEEGSALDLTSLLNELKFTYTDTSATIKLLTDDLLGLGIGLNVQMNFDRTKDESGSTYAFRSLNLSSVTYNTQTIKLSGSITPDNSSAVISRNPAQSTANLADYIDGIYNLLDSESYIVDISLENEFSLDAKAQVQLSGNFKTISVNAPITVTYGNLSAELTVYYTINLDDKNYGTVYLNLTSINGKQVSAKIYCEVSEVISSVKGLLEQFIESEQPSASVQTDQSANSVAETINKILAIDFAELICGLKADQNSLKINVNPDIVLKAFGIDFSVGEVALGVTLNDGIAQVSAEVKSFGLMLKVSGSDEQITAPNQNEYLDLTELLNGVKTLLDSESFEVEINLENEVTLNAKALVQLSEDFKTIYVNAPVSVTYGSLSAELSVYYTINLDDGNYGTVYLDLTSINGKPVTAKVYCGVSEVITAVQKLIGRFVSTAAYASETDGVASVIDTVVNIRFEQIINELYANANGITVDLNLDNIIDLGITLGNVQLELGVNDGLTLNGKLPELGLSLKVTGSQEVVTAPNADGYLELAGFVNSINAILDSESFEVEINLENEVTLNAKALVQLSEDYKTISVNAPVEVSYKGLYLQATVFYTVNLDNKDYGDVYLTITKINDTSFDARICCDIKNLVESVKTLIDLFTSENSITLYSDEADKVSDILGFVANLKLEEIISELVIDADGIYAEVNLDGVLNNLVNLGFTLGNVQVTLKDNNGLTLGCELPNLGLTLNVAGSEKTLTPPDTESYFNLNDLVAIVEQAYYQAQKIIEAQDIEFTLNATVTADGVVMAVNGYGEVVWANDALRVAFDATLSIYDSTKTTSESADAVNVKFVYDEAADTLVRFAINGLGMEISKDDIDGISDTFGSIISAVQNLAGSFSSESSEEVAALSDNVQTEETEDYSAYLKILQIALNELSKLTVKINEVEIEDATVKQLLISYANTVNLNLSANGGLALDMAVTDVLKVNAEVNAGECAQINKINTQLDSLNLCKATEEKPIIQVIYEYLFDVFENLSVENVLGSSTYTVQLDLYGDRSPVEALKDIDVHAVIYYNNANSATNGKKLVRTDLDLIIKGTSVKATAVLTNKTLYITLYEIAGTQLEDVSFKASADDIYSAAETIVNLITGDGLMQLISKLNGNTDGAQAAAVALSENGASNSLTDILNKILSLDFKQLVRFEKLESGENTLTVNADELISDLGYNVETGTVYIAVNPKTHAINASVQSGETPWLTLDAQAVENSEYGTFTPDDSFIDLCFVPMLLDDLVNTITDTDGNIYTLYTFSGDINIQLKVTIGFSINQTIPIHINALTAGLDENGKFYFSLVGKLDKVTALTMTLTESRYFSVTYSNGYITLGRDLGTSDVSYKIMTLNYLLDNMFNKTSNGDSPIRWLLGMKDTVWNTIAGLVPDMSSGLTNPETLYLFDNTDTDSEEKGVFKLSDLFNGFAVNDGKDVISSYGDSSAAVDRLNTMIDGLNLSGNYYAFDINADKLTNGLLLNLSAAILRNGEKNEISGIAACGTLEQSVATIKFSMNLDSYQKGVTDKYSAGTTDFSEKLAAPDYFAIVTDDKDINFNYEAKGSQYTSVFGCYTIDNKSSQYDYSKILNIYTLDVLDENGNTVLSKNLKSGSTVYVFDSVHWVGDKKLIYVDQYGNNVTATEFYDGEQFIGYGFVITYNAVIRPMYADSSERTFHFGDSVYTGDLYVGDILPEPDTLTYGEYTFAGWYLEEQCETYVTSVQYLVYDYYAKFVNTNITETNGVKYTFTRSTSIAQGGYYTAKGFDKNSADKDYSLSENVLVIPNYVNGYPVTRIGNGAFYYVNTGIYLKNVLVSENVTYVEAEAFRDNKDMETAVFLADTIFFGGSSYGENGNRFVFLGCSVYGNDSVSNLKVYYNKIDEHEEGYNSNWAGYQKGSSNNSGKNLVEGTNLFPEGTWAYVSFEADVFDYSLEQLGIKNFVTTVQEYDFNPIITDAEDVLRILMANDNMPFINGYRIVISGEYSLSSSVIMHVSYQAVESERWYKLGIVNDVASCLIVPEAENLIYINNTYYVKAGEIVNFNLTPADGYKFDALISDYAITETSIQMPCQETVVGFEWEFNTAQHIYVYSEVDFVYNNVEYKVSENADNTVKLENAALGAQLHAPEAINNNYAFIGWTYIDADGELQFTQVDVPETEDGTDRTYYAIWAANHSEDLDFKVSTQGTLPAAPETIAGYDGTFASWYTDADFINEVTSVNTNSTVLYARMSYTVTLFFDGSSGSSTNFIVTGNVNESKSSEDYTLIIQVNEGDSLTVNLEEKSGSYTEWFQTYTAYWNDCVVSYNGTTTTVHGQKSTSAKDQRTFTLNYNGADYSTGTGFTISDIRSNITVNASF